MCEACSKLAVLLPALATLAALAGLLPLLPLSLALLTLLPTLLALLVPLLPALLAWLIGTLLAGFLSLSLLTAFTLALAGIVSLIRCHELLLDAKPGRVVLTDLPAARAQISLSIWRTRKKGRGRVPGGARHRGKAMNAFLSRVGALSR